ncbi:hypothetical protein GW17_00033779 [Ensete ventricosum]|nr:hypothetical protein GW17_00033779 [Ensete ventricosum]RZS24795.1 hypothetical protein BHM03_00057909 [Ensete ventricosum]
MDSKKLSKITELVSFQQMLKKWKKRAVAGNGSSKSIRFLKRTLSLSGYIPKGCFAVCVGQEMQRFVIPTEYLRHTAFAVLLGEAEEEFGFEQEGVLRIPCEVSVFRSILKMVEKNKEGIHYC